MLATFSPSIDWGHEFVNSLRWVFEAFALSAVCLLAALVVLVRATGWGRQFWRVTGDYFTDRHNLAAWVMAALLLLSVVTSVRIAVLLSYYGNDVFTSLQVAFQGGAAGQPEVKSSGIHGFWMAIGIFAILAALHVVRYLADLYIAQRFVMRWRIWLTRRLIDDWLGDYAYFRGQFARDPIDNPDQRIQCDIDIFTTGVGGQANNPAYTSAHMLLFGAVEALLSVWSFGAILWHLSGPVTLGDFTIPKALFWIVIGYVAAATVIAFVIGRPLIRLSYLNELRNAGLRYALVHVRDAGAAVGLYRGEKAERSLLNQRLAGVMNNYRRWVHRMLLFTGWNLSMSQAINPLPFVVQAQALFARQISLGGVMQSATAFHMIHDSLSFFRNSYDEFAGYRAAVLRLAGLVEQNAKTRSPAPLQSTRSSDGALEVAGVAVRTPGGRLLVDDLAFRLEPGQTLLVSGPSGIGKTVLLESLAGLWPFAAGRIALPCPREDALFVPQLPYLPLGELRAVVGYPAEPGAVDDRAIQEALLKVALPQLALRLGDTRDWARELSVGEQQRIAFARVLVHTPPVVFLDESTASLDEGLELMLYTLLRAELPNAIVVSVSHRSTVEQFHARHLELVGDGQWRLDALAANT